jgi:SOS-response transcriptional repressor LexA
MYEAADVLRLIEARMQELGMTQVELGVRAFGKADNTAIQSLKRGSSPGLDRVAAMARALDLEVYLGPRREAGAVALVNLDGLDYATIPMHEASLSAGAGAENSGSNIVDYLAFRRDWLRRIGVSPTQASLARVVGDSMIPTLRSGDMVLIDMSHREPTIRKHRGRKPSIFAFIESGEARIKRIERPDEHTLLLLSDNSDFLPELRTGQDVEQFQTSIIGKVVWSGHTVHD